MAGLIFSGAVGVAGAFAGGLFSEHEFTHSRDSSTARICKVAAGALFGAVLFGTVALGITVVLSGKSLLFSIAFISLIALRIFLIFQK